MKTTTHSLVSDTSEKGKWISLLTPLGLSGTSKKLIKNMEAPFVLSLTYCSRFLKEVCLNIGSGNVTRRIKIDSYKFTLQTKQTINVSNFK